MERLLAAAGKPFTSSSRTFFHSNLTQQQQQTAADCSGSTLSGKVKELSHYSDTKNSIYISGQSGAEYYHSVRKCKIVLVLTSTLEFPYIFEHSGMIYLKSSKQTPKPSKTNSPLGKHPNYFTPYGKWPRYRIGVSGSWVRRRRSRDHLATDPVRSKLPPLSVPVTPVARLA